MGREQVEMVWVCLNCGGLEFDLEDPAIKVLQKSNRTALIEFEGRAHSLTLRSWNIVQKFRELMDNARSLSPANVYEDEPKSTDELLDALFDE